MSNLLDGHDVVIGGVSSLLRNLVSGTVWRVVFQLVGRHVELFGLRDDRRKVEDARFGEPGLEHAFMSFRLVRGHSRTPLYLAHSSQGLLLLSTQRRSGSATRDTRGPMMTGVFLADRHLSRVILPFSILTVPFVARWITHSKCRL